MRIVLITLIDKLLKAIMYTKNKKSECDGIVKKDTLSYEERMFKVLWNSNNDELKVLKDKIGIKMFKLLQKMNSKSYISMVRKIDELITNETQLNLLRKNHNIIHRKLWLDFLKDIVNQLEQHENESEDYPRLFNT